MTPTPRVRAVLFSSKSRIWSAALRERCGAPKTLSVACSCRLHYRPVRSRNRTLKGSRSARPPSPGPGGMALAPSQLAPGRGVAPGRVANAGAHRPSRMRQSGPAALRTLPMGAGDAGPGPPAQGPVGVMIRGPPIRPLAQATSAYFKSMLTYIVTTSLVRVP